MYYIIKQESRKGEFVYLVQKDLMEIDINMLDTETQTLSDQKWNGIIREKIKQGFFLLQ